MKRVCWVMGALGLLLVGCQSPKRVKAIPPVAPLVLTPALYATTNCTPQFTVLTSSGGLVTNNIISLTANNAAYTIGVIYAGADLSWLGKNNHWYRVESRDSLTGPWNARPQWFNGSAHFYDFISGEGYYRLMETTNSPTP